MQTEIDSYNKKIELTNERICLLESLLKLVQFANNELLADTLSMYQTDIKEYQWKLDTYIDMSNHPIFMDAVHVN